VLNTDALTTFLQLELICDKEWYVVWLENAYRIGLILGYGLTGGCADKFGLKISSMVFLALQCLTGLLTISMKEFAVVIFFLIIHGFCCTFLYVFPKTAGQFNNLKKKKNI
jgi:MFS family permease